MSTTSFTAIQDTIRQERLEHTLALADRIADFLIETANLFGRKAAQAGEQLDQISPYLPRSQA
jgi:hypothetical protein